MSLRLLIVSSSTGGGHDMRAKALREWVMRETDWEVTVHQALESTHGVYAFGVGLYNVIQRVAPVAHHAYFNYLELAGMHRKAGWILGADRFLGTLEAVRPDLIVSTHAHLNHGFFELAGRFDAKVRCGTYCGELYGGYGFSRHWVNPAADFFLGAVRPCTEQALKLGMPETRANTAGFLLRPEFHDDDYDADERGRFLEGELSMRADLPTILLATGAVGANNHLALLRWLERRQRPLQVIALCGQDSALLNKVRQWGDRARHVVVRPLARRGDMLRLLRSVDLVMARPGSGTTSEAILCGTPIVFNGLGGLMPQEYLTVKFARQAGFGPVVYRPHQLARWMDRTSDDDTLLPGWRAAVESARPREHPSLILERLAQATA